MTNAHEQKIDALTRVVERGFTALAADIADIRGTMATKDEFDGLRQEAQDLRKEMHNLRQEMHDGFVELRAELRSLRRDVDALAEQVANIAGFRQEIDHALERIRALEEHLGIGHEIRA